MCVRVCVHAHTHVSLFLAPSWVRTPLWLSDLSPATSVPQPEIEEMLLDARYIWAAGQSYPDV